MVDYPNVVSINIRTRFDINLQLLHQMADVSPSAKKVDEFLTSLSHLSQERLKDDQKRQRDLQKDIDHLRLKSARPTYSSSGSHNFGSPHHDIKQLNFNRSSRNQFYEKWKDTAPEMPPRPDEEPGPKLPVRSKPQPPPKMPKRPEFQAIEIIQPVKREVLAPKPVFHTAKPTAIDVDFASNAKRTPLSFSQLEKKIQDLDPKHIEKQKPPKPEKPGKLEQKASPPVKARPVAPPKPLKPTLNSYQDSDLLELRAQILRLSPTKATTVRATSSGFDAEQKGLLKSQLGKLSAKTAPVRPVKPAKFVPEEPEALSTLGKLKPAKPAPLKVQPKPEALRRLESMKKGFQAPAAPKAEEKPPANFQAELSSILRRSTAPSLGAPVVSQPEVSLQRSQTLPSSQGKLTHPNKSRSRGPKRRLPTMGASTSAVNSAATTPRTATLSGMQYPKPKKVPPPKGKKPNLDVKPRIVSGELFI